MNETDYELISLIFNTSIYFVFILWLLFAMSNKILNTQFKKMEENLFIFGSFLWIVYGIIELQRSYKEYLDN